MFEEMRCLMPRAGAKEGMASTSVTCRLPFGPALLQILKVALVVDSEGELKTVLIMLDDFAQTHLNVTVSYGLYTGRTLERCNELATGQFGPGVSKDMLGTVDRQHVRFLEGAASFHVTSLTGDSVHVGSYRL